MSRRGTTLVEVVVALLVLAIAALALAAGIARAEAARRRALEEGVALATAEAWLEAWRAAPWPAASDSGAGAVVRAGWRGTVAWRVAVLGPCIAEARVETSTAGRPWPAAALATRRFREGIACGP